MGEGKCLVHLYIDAFQSYPFGVCIGHCMPYMYTDTVYYYYNIERCDKKNPVISTPELNCLILQNGDMETSD